MLRANVGDITTIGFDRNGSFYYGTYNRQADVYIGPDMTPVSTFNEALNALPNGGTIYLEGDITEYVDKIKVQNVLKIYESIVI